MDMGKYVAVGVLAVIVLAAVTYEGPQGTPRGEGIFRGSYGPQASPERKAPAVAPRVNTLPAGFRAASRSAPAPANPLRELQPPSSAAQTAPQQASRESTPDEQAMTYTVRANQTLSDIAGEILGDRTRWPEIHQLNRETLTDPDHVREGMKLFISKIKKLAQPEQVERPQESPQSQANSPASARSYTVVKGDTLYSIARRELGSGKRWPEIVALNKLGSEQVSAGVILRLPAK